MIFWVRKDACKYDNIGNEYGGHSENKGLYRNWLCEVKSKEGKSTWLSHNEYFDREHECWESSIYGKSEFEIKEPKNLNDYKQVNEQECSNSCIFEYKSLSGKIAYINKDIENGRTIC